MRLIYLKRLGISLILISMLVSSVYGMQGPPNGNKERPGKGEETEAFGNNLSIPVIFAENLDFNGKEPSGLTFRGDAYPVKNLISSTICDIDINGDKIFQQEEQNRSVYLQKTENTWQAQWGIGQNGSPESVNVDWGDNLINKVWWKDAKIRVETVMYKTAPNGMKGYEMGWIKNQGPLEVWGTTGNLLDDLIATVYSANARLKIEKLDDQGGNPIYTAFNHSAWEGFGLEDSDKNRYKAEINVGGKLIYGYNWDLGGSQFPEGITKEGWYRLTFSIDKYGDNNGAQIQGNVNFNDVSAGDKEGKFQPVIIKPSDESSSAAISILEIEIASEQKGGKNTDKGKWN